MDKLVKILSIDGGGIRGIIPGQIIVTLEEKLRIKSGNPEARVADYFDLIAGTSTGGILTCIYLCPEMKGSKKAKFSAEEAVSLYLQKGGLIFDISLWKKIASVGGLTDEKYDQKMLENIIKEYFGELRLSDLLKPTLIPAYDIEERRAKFFTQHDAVIEPEEDYFVWEVARATSAAPTFFETAGIRSFSNDFYPLIDGGVFANNPSLCAYAEVRNKFPGRPTAKDMAILSLGTGFVKKKYPYKKAKSYGLIEWVRPVLDIMMSGVSETVDYQLRKIYEAVEKQGQYIRINSDLKYAMYSMDCATDENLANLQKEGKRIADENDEALEKFADILLNY